MVSEVKDYEFSSWGEYIDKNSTLLAIMYRLATCFWLSICLAPHTQGLSGALAYVEGMLWVAYGVKIIIGTVSEWQIDKVKECALNLKEAEIGHSPLNQTEKEKQKHQWKLCLDSTAQGYKDKLKEEWRLVYG